MSCFCFFLPPDRDKTHVDWVKAYISIWTQLQDYIKKYHTTGLSWSKTVSLQEQSVKPLMWLTFG